MRWRSSAAPRSRAQSAQLGMSRLQLALARRHPCLEMAVQVLGAVQGLHEAQGEDAHHAKQHQVGSMVQQVDALRSPVREDRRRLHRRGPVVDDEIVVQARGGRQRDGDEQRDRLAGALTPGREGGEADDGQAHGNQPGGPVKAHLRIEPAATGEHRQRTDQPVAEQRAVQPAPAQAGKAHREQRQDHDEAAIGRVIDRAPPRPPGGGHHLDHEGQRPHTPEERREAEQAIQHLAAPAPPDEADEQPRHQAGDHGALGQRVDPEQAAVVARLQLFPRADGHLPQARAGTGVGGQCMHQQFIAARVQLAVGHREQVRPVPSHVGLRRVLRDRRQRCAVDPEAAAPVEVGQVQGPRSSARLHGRQLEGDAVPGHAPLRRWTRSRRRIGRRDDGPVG